MLCLTLREGDLFVVSTPHGDVQIKVGEIRTHSRHVRIGIDAPIEFQIGRASEWPRAGTAATAATSVVVAAGKPEALKASINRSEQTSRARAS